MSRDVYTCASNVGVTHVLHVLEAYSLLAILSTKELLHQI